MVKIKGTSSKICSDGPRLDNFHFPTKLLHLIPQRFRDSFYRKLGSMVESTQWEGHFSTHGGNINYDSFIVLSEMRKNGSGHFQ